MKAAKHYVLRRRIRITAGAPFHELGIAADDTGVVSPRIKRPHGNRAVRERKIENAVVPRMTGHKIAQLGDYDLLAVERWPMHAREQEDFSDHEYPKEVDCAAFLTRPVGESS